MKKSTFEAHALWVVVEGIILAIYGEPDSVVVVTSYGELFETFELLVVSSFATGFTVLNYFDDWFVTFFVLGDEFWTFYICGVII